MTTANPLDPRPKAYNVGTSKCLLVERHTNDNKISIGTTGLVFCIGIYVEMSPTNSFCWHIWGDAISSPLDYHDMPANTRDFAKISGHIRGYLQGKLGNCTDWGRKSLVLATARIGREANMAIVDGMLEWGRVEKIDDGMTKKKWKDEHLKEASGFVVKEPGKGVDNGNVEYFDAEPMVAVQELGRWQFMIHEAERGDEIGFPLDRPVLQTE